MTPRVTTLTRLSFRRVVKPGHEEVRSAIARELLSVHRLLNANRQSARKAEGERMREFFESRAHDCSMTAYRLRMVAIATTEYVVVPEDPERGGTA